MDYKFKTGILSGITLIAVIIISVIPPIPQNTNYHFFADSRSEHSIPNFLNVASNIPFLFIGLFGMWSVRKSSPRFRLKELSLNCFGFYLGIFFTGIGSAYYHLHPTNFTLVWDRLPMTISFMALMSVIIGDFICLKTGKRILIPLLLIGFLSIQYWVMTENRGCGDLRFYALVQYLPILLIPVILFLFKGNRLKKHYLWLMILAYGFAKLFEYYDENIFNALKIISGHTIKHLFAALAPLIFLMGIKSKSESLNESGFLS